MNGDVGAVLSAIGGRFAWRYWWPAVPWLADVAMVATFRQENTQEPAGVLFLVCLATVPLLWLWGARFAVALGHDRRRVFPMLVALSVGLPMLWQIIGSIARVTAGRVHRRDLLGDPHVGWSRLGRLGRFPHRTGLSRHGPSSTR